MYLGRRARTIQWALQSLRQRSESRTLRRMRMTPCLRRSQRSRSRRRSARNPRGGQTNGTCEPPCTTCDPYDPPPSPEPYDAPDDPSPGAPGAWLGDAVSPAACFRNYNSAIADRDGDALDDGCEYKLARAFAPELRFHNRKECGGGDKYWAAKYFAGPGVIRVAYLPGYYNDCGVPNEFKNHCPMC